MTAKRHIQPFRFGIALLLVIPSLVACQSNDEPAAPTNVAPTATIAREGTASATQEVVPTNTVDTVAEEQAGATHTTAPSPTDAAMELCDTADRVGGGGALHAAAQPLTGSIFPRADSWVAFDGIESLTWASHLIVQARIAAECPEMDEMGFLTYVVEVERTFRGATHDFVAVQGIGDRYGSRPPPAVGDELVLFIDEASWSVGGPQGTFYIKHGLVGAEYGFTALTLDEFAQAVAVALSGAPPEGLPIPPVPLDVSPPGPDLPPPAASRPAGCGGSLSPMAFQGRETLRLLWSSHHVFAGTVIEQLPSFQVSEPELESDPLLLPIVTDYLMRIENPIRGLPDDVIRVRRLGGELEGCSVTNGEGQLLEVGRRALVFVWTPETGSADPTYYLNGGRDGFWLFEDGEALVAREGREDWDPTVVPTQAFTDGLMAALRAEPPAFDGFGLETIPLEAAPAAQPVAWPALPRASSMTWVPFQHQPLGIGFDYPEGWSIHDDPGLGAVSIASYETVGGDWESIPDGGLRIDIRILDRPGYGSQTPLVVGRDGYVGSVYFVGLVGDTFHVYITYEVAGQLWEIAGYFKEPADLDNPSTRPFFAIVLSVSHDTANTS